MAGDTGAVVGDLAGRLGRVEEQLAEFHRRSAHRELVIDRLHGENQQLRAGVGKIILEPVVADLIRLDDQLNREVRRLESEGRSPDDEKSLRLAAGRERKLWLSQKLIEAGMARAQG